MYSGFSDFLKETSREPSKRRVYSGRGTRFQKRGRWRIFKKPPLPEYTNPALKIPDSIYIGSGILSTRTMYSGFSDFQKDTYAKRHEVGTLFR